MGGSPASTRSRFAGGSFRLMARTTGKSSSKNPEVPHAGCVVFSPHFSDIGKGHVVSGDITVEDGLIQGIAALDFDVIHLVGEGWGAQQGEDEIALILPTFALGMATTSYLSNAARIAGMAGSGVGSVPGGLV